MRQLFCFVSLVVISHLAVAATNSSFPITGHSDNPNIETFDRNMVSFMRRWHMPGAALVVMKDGKVTTARGYGWADMQNLTPVQPNDLFRLASSSKTFTAVTVLKLIQDGKLHLDDKVFEILNNLQPLNGRSINPQIYQITVQNLLQMSSGWFNPGAGHFDPMFGPWPKNFLDTLYPELPASCETTTRYMMSQPLRHKPGTTYVYSNMDYCILGLVINKVTGTPYGYQGYENYVKSQILAPLGIHDMAIGSTQQKYRLPNEVNYYRPPGSITPQELANSFYLPYSNMEILRKNFANGGWVASAFDLATFIQALKHGQILNSQYLNIMQTKPAFSPKNKMIYYTMGGIIDNLPGGKINWIQTGSFTGTNAFIISKPDDTTIAVIFNSRPSAGEFLARTRPELKRLLLNSGL